MNNCNNETCEIPTRISSGKYGVTKYGFRRKLYSEALSERMSRAKEVFGVNIDLSETSFLGKLIRNLSWDETELWELAEDVYYSAFVNSAEGTGLDDVGMYLTITRRPAVKSKGTLTIYGTSGTKVAKGFRVSTTDNIMFETVEDTVIVKGQIEVPIISIGAGKGNNVAEKSITEIINPQLGIDKVINLEQTEGGLDVETDDEFRERYKKSYSRGGGSTVPAIHAALLDIDNVADADVRENVMMEEVDGLPPKSVACYIFGGDDNEIAKVIYENKSAGIQAFGETVIDVEDKKGIKHKIGFTRAKVQNIWVKLRLTKAGGYKGDDAIKRAVINYIGGIDDDGIEYSGLKLGNDVIYSRVLGAIMCLGGVADAEILLSTDGKDYVSENIIIDKNTIARTSIERVVIENV